MAASSALARRRALADDVARAYAENPNVAAVLLAGSVGRGLADDWSDIEVDVFWRVPPTGAELRAAWSDNGWQLVGTSVEDHEWADSFVVEGIKVDTSQFLVATLDAWIDAVLQDGDTDPEYQVRITAIRDGQPLHGADVIEDWRVRTDSYPEVLMRSMIDDGLELWPRMRLEMLAQRNDVLLLHSDLVDVMQGILSVLMGLNRRYAPHPWHKWLDWEISQLPIAPADLNQRIRTALTLNPAAAVDATAALVQETFDLVDVHLPDFDTTQRRLAFDTRRTS